MMSHDLHTFMSQITSEMASEYDRIYERAAEDPGTAGDEGEENWARLFKEWLPPTYHVETKGRLISHDGRMSPQVDVVILKPAYPRKLLEKKTWLAGGVAAVFECKTTLTAAHVAESMVRAAQCKDLYAAREGTPRKELRSPLIYGLLAHSHSWKGEKSDPLGNVERVFARGWSDVTHPRFEMDVLCVADLATWSSTIIPCYGVAWRPAAEQVELTKLYGGPFGPMSGMTCSSESSETQKDSFRPVGSLINDLTRRIAWEDASVRDIADYFRRADLGGAGAGEMSPWPLSVYSAEVGAQIAAGRFTNGLPWDEWSLGGL